MNDRTAFAMLVLTPMLAALGQALIRIGMKPLAEMAAGDPWRAVAGAAGSPAVLAGLGLYVFCTLGWLLLLARYELSYAYPFLGLGFVVASAIGVGFLGEPLPPVRLVGTLLIVAGVALVARS